MKINNKIFNTLVFDKLCPSGFSFFILYYIFNICIDTESQQDYARCRPDQCQQRGRVVSVEKHALGTARCAVELESSCHLWRQSGT